MPHNQKALRAILFVFFFSVLASCTLFSSGADTGSNNPKSPPTHVPEDKAGTNGTAVGFLFVGAVDDFGYNQAIYQSTVIVEKALPHLHMLRQENVPENIDAETIMEEMIEKGAKIIFPLSSGYMESTIHVAKKHPDVVFFIPGGDKTLPNLGVYSFSYWKEMYLMGVAAGKSTETGKAGYVVAFPSSRILLQINAFEIGLRSVLPHATTKVIFTNDWCDPLKQAHAANSLIDEGIDVITQVQNCTKTVHLIAEKRGIKTIGYHVDGSGLAPDSWVVGLLFDRSKLLLDMIQTVDEGHFTGSRYDGSFIAINDQEKVIRLAPFGKMVPNTVKELLNDQLANIQTGKLNPMQGPIKDQQEKIRIQEGTTPSEQDLGQTDYFVEGIIGEIPKK